MSEKKTETVELSEDEMEKVQGGITTAGHHDKKTGNGITSAPDGIATPTDLSLSAPDAAKP